MIFFHDYYENVVEIFPVPNRLILIDQTKNNMQYVPVLKIDSNHPSMLIDSILNQTNKIKTYQNFQGSKVENILKQQPKCKQKYSKPSQYKRREVTKVSK